jgi:hypothetical protein
LGIRPPRDVAAPARAEPVGDGGLDSSTRVSRGESDSPLKVGVGDRFWRC